MPTGPNIDRPFAAPELPSAEQLKAYLAGQLSDADAHAIERALEEDSLLREAVEGLQGPDALDGLNSLGHYRPNGPRSSGPGPMLLVGAIAGIALVAGIWLVVSPLLDRTGTSAAIPPVEDRGAVPEMPVGQTLPLVMDKTEIAAAVEQPESLRIGHSFEAPLVVEKEQVTPIERETGVLPMPSTRPKEPVVEPVRMRPERASRGSRQLLFLHDLKLVHPKELYPIGPAIDTEQLGVSARYTDRNSVESFSEAQRLQQYTAFMDAALAKFKINDHKGCLEDLRFLLEQYPDDVNALFYAGLCSHNLALYGRARSYLHRAATHSFDTFYEEAVWYHALTLERMGEVDAAREAYARIVAEDGFYAERASTRSR